jgi:hypothetical protein
VTAMTSDEPVYALKEVSRKLKYSQRQHWCIECKVQ